MRKKHKKAFLIEDPGTEGKGEGPRRRGSKRYRGNWSDSGARPGVDEVGPGKPGLFRVLGYMPARKEALRSMHDNHFRSSGDQLGYVAYSACLYYKHAADLAVEVKTLLGREEFIKWPQTSNAPQGLVR